MIIDQNGGPVDVAERRSMDDFRYMVQAALKSNKNGGKAEDPLLHSLNALCGGAKVTASPEQMLLRLEQINSLLTTLVFMDHRLQRAVIKLLGLFGESESTWNEIGKDFNVSRERARQIFHRALRILRKKHLRRSMFDSPIINSITCCGSAPFLPTFTPYHHWKIAKNMMLIDWKVARIALF